MGTTLVWQAEDWRLKRVTTESRSSLKHKHCRLTPVTTFPTHWNLWGHSAAGSGDHSHWADHSRHPLNWRTSQQPSNLPYTGNSIPVEVRVTVWQRQDGPRKKSRSYGLTGLPREAASAALSHTPAAPKERLGHLLLNTANDKGHETFKDSLQQGREKPKQKSSRAQKLNLCRKKTSKKKKGGGAA